MPEDRGGEGLIRQMALREKSRSRCCAGGAGLDIDRGAEVASPSATWRFRIRASSVEQVAEKLSGGNQQKVVLGKWLATQPRVLIMDEPTRGIDIGAKSEIHRLMSELARRTWRS